MGSREPVKRSQLSPKSTAIVLAAVVAGMLLLHFWVYIFERPPHIELTLEQRKAVLLSALKGKAGVAALTERGMAALQRDDVAEVAGSRCTSEIVCTQERSGRRSPSRCVELARDYFCAYELIDKEGGTAAALVATAQGGRGWRSIPDLSPGSADFLYELVLTERPNRAAAQSKLCEMGYCSSVDLATWRRPRAIAPTGPVDPDAEARRACGGVLANIVGKGKTCLDTSDPVKREFRDCVGNFCGPVMVAILPGHGVRGVSDAELARLKIDFPDFSQLGKDEHPEHELTIAYDLAVGKFEVTFDDWDACVRARGCLSWPPPNDADWGRGQRPVINVSFDDINREYLPWLNGKLGLKAPEAYRLLSDGEWEYAARAGTTSRYAFGDSITRADANYKDTPITEPPGQTVEVGSYAPNAFGLHDMHGNVAEWVQDCMSFLSRSSDLPLDGSPRTTDSFRRECSDSETRVFRGGSFVSGANGVRSATRQVVDPKTRSKQIGFRVARTLYRPPQLDAPTAPKGPVFLEK